MEKPILAAMLSCEGTHLTDEEKYLFAEYNPLGVSLFARNLESKSQLKSLVEEIKNAINRDDVLIAIDEEGGRVSRLKNIGYSSHADAENLGKKPIEYATIHATLIAEEMRTLGINVNYSPVADKKSEILSKALEGRCFSDDTVKIVDYARAMINRYIDMAICPCVKHIPGHFGVSADPHLSVIANNWPKEQILEEIEYLQNLKDCPMAMTSHILLTSIDSQYPTSMSKKVIIEVIRGYLGFDSFLISDAIDMYAIQGTIRDKAINCWQAGADAICYCSGDINDQQQICAEKRFLTEKSLIRFAKIKNILHNTPKYTDVDSLKKRYEQEFQSVLNLEYQYDATEVLHQMLKKGEPQ